MKKNLLFIFLNCIAVYQVFTQDVTSSGKKVKENYATSAEYSRNALTLVLLDFNNESFSTELKDIFNKEVKVPDKFDDNLVSTRFIRTNLNRDLLYKTEGGKTVKNKDGIDTKEPIITSTNRIKNLITDNKISNQVIAKWFNRNSDGEFNYNLIQERGIYNAKDADFKTANSSKLGIKELQNAGEKLLQKSYIMVCDYSGIRTMEEIYNAKDEANRKAAANTNTEFKPIKRTQNGYSGSIIVHLFKIVFNDSISSIFSNELWVADKFPENKDEKNLRINNFNNFNFPLFPIKTVTAESEGLQYNADQGIMAPSVQLSKQELFLLLVDNGINNALEEVEKTYSEFRVKAPIVSVKPVGIKIGTKEGLKLDKRYFVLEKREDNQNKLYIKRIAVIRSKKVIDNRASIGGKTDTSLFYQTAGRKIIKDVMYAEQANDLGIGIVVGYAVGGEIGGLSGRVEYNISQLMGSAKVPTAIRTFVEGGIEFKDYNVESNLLGLAESENVVHGFIRLGAGFEKDFYFFRNYHFCPYVAYDYEMMQFRLTKDDPDPYSFHTFMLHTGVRFGANITHSIQFITSVNYFLPGNVSLSKGDQKFSIDAKWSDFFKDRKGLSYEFGLRFQF
ncbi:MAG: hypothetical protein WCO13_14740 [Bacteroidota bacterium]